MDNDKKNSLVVRHNKLIESRHRLALPERRFMLWVISKIRKEDDDFKVYSLKVSDFVEFAGLKGTKEYYTRIASLANSLTQKNVAIKDNENAKYKAYSWFASIIYAWNEGIIEAKINPDLKPYLLQLKEQFTVIQLEYALLLRHESSHRLYDLLKQYQKIGTRHITLAQLREMMDIGTKKYPRYRDFRRYVIEVAQKELADKTDISFTFEPTKTGRKITGLLFVITENKPTVTIKDSPEETNPDTEKLFKRLLKHGVKERIARMLVSDYDGQQVLWHIKDHEFRIKKGEKITTGRLVMGIQEDWRPQKTIFEKEEKEKQENKQKERKRQEALKKTVERLQAKFDKIIRGEAEEVFTTLDQEEQEATENSFKNAYGSVVKNDSKERKKVMTQMIFAVHMRQQYPDKFMSLLEYAKTQGVKPEVLQAIQEQ